jgi:ATP-binding cassette subfamily B protein
VFGPLWYFIRRYRRLYALLVLVAMGAGAVESLAIAALYPVLSLVLGGTPAGGGSLLTTLAALIEPIPPNQRVAAGLTVFVALTFVSIGAKLGREWLSSHVATRISFDVKRRVFARLIRAPYLYLAALPPGDLTYRLTNAPPYLTNTLLIFASLVGLSLSSLFALALLFSIEPRATAAVTVLGLLFFAVNRYAVLGFSVRAGRRKFHAAAAEVSIVSEFTTGSKEIDVAGAGTHWLRRLAEQADIHRRELVRDLLFAVTPGLAMELTVMTAIGVSAVALHAAAPEVLGSGLPIVAVYALAVRSLLVHLSQISRNWLRLGGIAADIHLLQQSLEEPYPAVKSGATAVPREWKTIELDRVSVTYPSRPSPALSDVSLRIDRGRFVGLAGASGSGKSTILHLILRLFDPTDGAVRLDGIDLGTLRRDEWLAQVGFVGQDGFVLDGTVRENIAFGRDDPDDAIRRAAEDAYASEFIERLPQGYDTYVGARGLSLSAGQRQRLLIARALVRRPTVLLLDEATAALDGRSEAMVQAALERLRGACTIIVVAHRVATVREADAIVVLERGQIVETGTHQMLMSGGGTYAQLMWTQQRAAPSLNPSRPE